MSFTGLKIEEHKALDGREVCVWYIAGERVAVIYAHADEKQLRVMAERDVTCSVLQRAGVTSFLDVTDEVVKDGEDSTGNKPSR